MTNYLSGFQVSGPIFDTYIFEYSSTGKVLTQDFWMTHASVSAVATISVDPSSSDGTPFFVAASSDSSGPFPMRSGQTSPSPGGFTFSANPTGSYSNAAGSNTQQFRGYPLDNMIQGNTHGGFDVSGIVLGPPASVTFGIDQYEAPTFAWGSITPSGSNTYYVGSTVALSATPNPSFGATFVSWTSRTGGTSIACSKCAQTTALITPSDSGGDTVTADFGGSITFNIQVDFGLPNNGQWSVEFGGQFFYSTGSSITIGGLVGVASNTPWSIPTIYTCSLSPGCSYVSTQPSGQWSGLGGPLTPITFAFEPTNGVSQPVAFSYSPSGSPVATFSVIGCNAYPAAVLGSGVQTITAAPGCNFLLYIASTASTR